MVDYDTKSFKMLNSLHYKVSNTVEAIFQSNFGSGTTVYTGSERYSIKNFSINQFKFELKGNDFFLRAYTTRENSGDSYNATALAAFMNETYSPSSAAWVPTYFQNFTGAILPVAVGGAGLCEAAASAFAISKADA